MADPDDAAKRPGPANPAVARQTEQVDKKRTMTTSDPTANDPGVPKQLTYLAIIVGLILAVGGTFAMTYDRVVLFGPGKLAVCVGFGLVLAAFGSRAGGTWSGISVVGGGALALVLYGILPNMPTIPTMQPYLRGELHGTSKLQGLSIVTERSLLVGRRAINQDFEFIAFDDDLKSSHFYILLTPDTTAQAPKEKEAYIGCRAMIESCV